MNQLFRGGELSRCALRASRRAFSTSELASVVPGQNLITQKKREPTENNRRGFPIETPLALRSSSVHGFNGSISLNRNFSSLSVDAETTPTDGQELAAPFAAVKRSGPSALEKANLAEVTPGHAMGVLQKYAAKGEGHMIRQSDFTALCESARPGKQRDAMVIATALKEFKRNNKFVLQLAGASDAVDGMLRAMTPTWKVQDGKPRLKAAMFVAEQIVDEKTGLYFAIENKVVSKVLGQMHDALQEIQNNGVNLRIGNIDEEAEEEPSADEKMLRDALRVTDQVVKLLIKRKSRPEMKMKKRARRVYLKILQIGSGPNKSTLKLATEISLLIGGRSAARENIVSPHVTPYHANSWYTENVEKYVVQMIEEAPEEPEDEKLVEADEVAEGDDVESASGDEGGDLEGIDSQVDAPSEEEKKD